MIELKCIDFYIIIVNAVCTAITFAANFFDQRFKFLIKFCQFFDTKAPLSPYLVNLAL